MGETKLHWTELIISSINRQYMTCFVVYIGEVVLEGKIIIVLGKTVKFSDNLYNA
jgi:hypothetical protein